MSYKNQELFTLHEHLGFTSRTGLHLQTWTSPPELDFTSGYLEIVRVAHLFSFLCCVFLLCLSLSCVLCTRCCQCLWIVCPCPVFCVPDVASVSGLLVFVLCFVYPMLPVSLDCLSLSCVLCTRCCQCLWIVCLCPVFCVPGVTCVSGWFILDYPFGFL
jgi:hypothetical protein